jgi:hypothetical protein
VENAEDEGEGEGEGGGEEEEQWLAVETAEAGGELRELLSTVFCLCSSFSAPLFTFATQHKKQLEIAFGSLAV